MQWPSPVQEAIFLKRYKRFFADIQFKSGAEKTIEVAHVANTGSLKSAIEPGRPCLVTPATNPERKLRWTLEAVQSEAGHWVGVNTSWPNQLAHEAFTQKIYPHWHKFDSLQREVAINKATRLDLCLTDSKSGKKHFVEIKNVTMKDDTAASFPDSVTERGQKHLRELMDLVDQGHSAEILFTVQRGDCTEFKPAEAIDPEYAKLLKQASKKGVRISAYTVHITPQGLSLTDKGLPVRL